MKPARIVLIVIVCLLAGTLVLSAAPASSRGSNKAAASVRSFVQQRRTEAFWRKAIKNAKPAKLLRSAGSTIDAPAAGDDVGAPVVIPPAGPQGTDDGGLPKYVAYRGAKGSGGFPPIPHTTTEITDPSLAPFRQHGKIFFMNGGDSYVCSGTVVNSTNESVVATAGHCVYDDQANLANSSTMFIPGYKNGAQPYGVWDATQVLTTQQWMNGAQGDYRYDVGMLVLEQHNGQSIQDAVGARGIAFNQGSLPQFDAIGYPAAPPFDGERLYQCDSTLGYLDPQYTNFAPNAIGCSMTQGSSGGGWVINSAQGEVVNSVTSYGYDAFPGLLFGPQLGSVAQALYDTAAGNAVTSPSPGTSPTPTATGQVDHQSLLTLTLKKHLRAKGLMSSTDAFVDCTQGAEVGIYKLVSPTEGRLVGRFHNTGSDGRYGFGIPDKKGKYFANVDEIELSASHLCLQAQSSIVKHRHN